MLSGNKGAQYNIFSTSVRKKLLVVRNNNYNTFLSINTPKDIYILKYGKANPVLIGKGLGPKLHLQDNWVSFFKQQTKTISFVNTSNKALNFKIKLFNKINPYFIPEVEMISSNKIIYTDINNEGLQGLLKFSVNMKKISPIYKTKSYGKKLEICINGNTPYLGSFPYFNNDQTSSIWKINTVPSKTDQLLEVYTSKSKDIGNMQCNIDHNKIFFIKNTKADQTEVAQLDLINKSYKSLTNVKNATQIVNMDGRLIFPYMGKYYLIFGKDMSLTDNLYKKDPKGK